MKLILVAAIFLSSIVILFGGTEIALRLTYHVDYFEPIPTEFAQIRLELRPDGTWTYDDFQGHDYTIRDHIRLTTDAPAVYRHRLYIFGNSTMLGVFASDSQTAASVLQRQLNAAGVQLLVQNEAVAGMSAVQELQRLKTLSLHSGDIIMFVDGLVEEVSSRLCTNSDGRVDYLVLYVACDDVNLLWRPNLTVVISDYRHTLTQAQAYSAVHGAVFVHILQPRPFLDGPFYTAYGQQPTLLPRSLFADDKHLTPEGEQIWGKLLFCDIELSQFAF